MAFEFLTTKVTGNNTLAVALGNAIADPKRAQKHLKDAQQIFYKARGYGLGSTGKFFKDKLRDAFNTNVFGWDDNAKVPFSYINRTGYATGNYSIKSIVAANKPGFGARGRKKPKARILGGRLRNAMFHRTIDKIGYLGVGVLRDSEVRSTASGKGWEEAFESFQTAGTPFFGGNKTSMNRYMHAIGIPWSNQAPRQRPARPLIEPMARKYPPQIKYSERFTKKLLELT